MINDNVLVAVNVRPAHVVGGKTTLFDICRAFDSLMKHM